MAIKATLPCSAYQSVDMYSALYSDCSCTNLRECFSKNSNTGTIQGIFANNIAPDPCLCDIKLKGLTYKLNQKKKKILR